MQLLSYFYLSFLAHRCRRHLIEAVLTAFCVSLCLTGTAQSGTLHTDPNTFQAALAKVAPGDKILLAPGNYGVLRLDQQYGDATRRVTLTSADPNNRARFSHLEMHDAQGLTLEQLVFEFRFPSGSDPNVLKASKVHHSQHITIRDSLFDGDAARGTGTAADGFGAGFGLWVRFSQNIQIENSTFRGWYRGILAGKSTGITLRGSDFYDMRSDGVNFAEVTDVLIEGNLFRDFRRRADDPAHPDMIQFWTNGTDSPNRNITIRDNILNARNGDWTQSIFMRNERVDVQGAGPEMYYRNIVITGNIIINAHLHGITLGESDGVLIADNTLIHNHAARLTGSNRAVHIPVINLAPVSRNVSILRNITGGISGAQGQPDWRLASNLKIQDQSSGEPGYYDIVFVAALNGDPATLDPFMYLPDGPAGTNAFGAPGLRLKGQKDHATATKAPLVKVARNARFVNRFTFDATLDRAASAPNVLWVFGDGTTGEGARVTHTFPRPGLYWVSARARSAAQAAEARVEVNVPDPQVLLFEHENILVQHEGKMRALDGVVLQVGNVLPLGQGRTPVEIHPNLIGGFFGAHDMALDLRLRAATTSNPAGEIMRIHNNIVLSMTGQGQIQFSLNTAETSKPAVIATGPLGLHDGAWHDIGLRYDAQGGMMSIFVNGVEHGRGRTHGKLRAMESWGIYFGNPWKKKTFDGEIADMDLRTDAASFALP